MDDPVYWVHSHPERFFKTGVANEIDLAQSIWMDATLSHVPDVLLHHDDKLWVVAGSANWLVENGLLASDLFVRVVPLSVAGPNSMRSEILLNAFCTEVVAVIAGVTVFTKGGGTVSASLGRVLQRWSGLEAAVGFRL